MATTNLLSVPNGFAYAIPLLKELNTGIQIETRTVVFIELLITPAKKWKQPKCLSTHEQMN